MLLQVSLFFCFQRQYRLWKPNAADLALWWLRTSVNVLKLTHEHIFSRYSCKNLPCNFKRKPYFVQFQKSGSAVILSSKLWQVVLYKPPAEPPRYMFPFFTLKFIEQLYSHSPASPFLLQDNIAHTSSSFQLPTYHQYWVVTGYSYCDPITMNPNTIVPSPPSSLCSSSSIESMCSTAASSKTIPPTSTSVPLLPYGLQLNIFKYAQEELESICFEILQSRAPAVLDKKDIECKEMLELNWACRKLPEYCPDIDRRSLCDWIPDIRHAAVHRDKMTATAACKTLDEAAKLAFSLNFDKIADKLRKIATEMDWARCEMKNKGALTIKDLDKDVKEAIENRLMGVLAVIKAGTESKWHCRWEISREVTTYTMDDKIRAIPWSATSNWGQDRNRNYFRSRSSVISTSPPCSSPQPRSWRGMNGDETTQSKSRAYVPPAKREGSWANRGTSH